MKGDTRNQGTHTKLLPLTSDLIFKAVFGRDNAECKQLLIAMLNLILERQNEPIIGLIVKNPFSYADEPCGKYIIMDIKAILSTGEWIDIEMQVEQLGGYIDRSIYYGAKLISEQLEIVESYATIKPGIVISIVCGKLFPDIKEAHTVFCYKERKQNFELTDKSELHFLELDKINVQKPIEQMTPLERFGAYMRYAADPARKDYIRSLLDYGDEVISMTDKMLRQISQDEQMKELKRTHDLSLFFQRCQLGEARQEGRAEGKAEARREGIEALILDNLEEQKTEQQILDKLKRRFSLDEQEAKEYLSKYIKKVAAPLR